MDQRKRKMMAPVAITVVFLVYLGVYGAAVLAASSLTPAMLAAAVPVLALGGGMVYVLRERIREIRSGEEDDLDNY